MSEIKHGSCHCGAVQFTVELENGLGTLRRCNCSICRRKGAIMAVVPVAGLRITRGADRLVLYQFNTRTAKHYFCGTCGIYTHHHRRMNPQECGFNVGCLEDVDPSALENIELVNGAAMSVVGD